MGTRYGWRSGRGHAKAMVSDGKVVLDERWLSAQELSLQTSGTAATAGQNDDVPALLFDASDEEDCTFSFKLPDNMTKQALLKIFAYWNSNASSGSVVWDLDWRSTALGEDTASGSVNNVTNTETASADTDTLEKSSAFEVAASSLAPGDIFHGRFRREAPNASDDMSGDARLIGLLIQVIEPKEVTVGRL